MTAAPISAADREKAHELCAKATPGPWATSRPTEYDARTQIETAEDYIATTTAINDPKTDEDNAAFIAFSRTAIPSYEARVVELEAEAQHLREERDSFQRVGIAAGSLANQYNNERAKAEAKLRSSEARATALLEALRPFADEADIAENVVNFTKCALGDEVGRLVPLGDLRAARAAINAGASHDRK